MADLFGPVTPPTEIAGYCLTGNVHLLTEDRYRLAHCLLEAPWWTLGELARRCDVLAPLFHPRMSHGDVWRMLDVIAADASVVIERRGDLRFRVAPRDRTRLARWLQWQIHH